MLSPKEAEKKLDAMTIRRGPMSPDAQESLGLETSATGQARPVDQPPIPENAIPLPDDLDLVEFIQAAYKLSKPQGLGVYQDHRAELTADQARKFVNDEFDQAMQVSEAARKHGHWIVGMDYINGRAVKMNVWRDGWGRTWIRDDWYDHSDSDLAELLVQFGIRLGDFKRERKT